MKSENDITLLSSLDNEPTKLSFSAGNLQLYAFPPSVYVHARLLYICSKIWGPEYMCQIGVWFLRSKQFSYNIPSIISKEFFTLIVNNTELRIKVMLL